MMRFLVFGSGAVGTLVGGLLAKAGHRGVLIGRSWNIEGIRNKGISISGIWGEHRISSVPCYESIEAIPNHQREFDLVIITVKSFDTENAILSCFPVIQDQTIVISCQNGYGNCQKIADQIGWQKTLGIRFITGVELPEPGVIRVTVHADALRLGHYLCQFPTNQLESLARIFREAGIPTQATDQLEQYIWAKILYNAALNPLGAMLGVTYGALAENESTRSIMDKIIEEAFTVTSQCGIRQFWSNGGDYKEAFYHQMVPPTASHFPSMLRDLEKGRRTEIDVLNGAICQLGKDVQKPTPVNDTIVSLIHFREKNRNL